MSAPVDSARARLGEGFAASAGPLRRVWTWVHDGPLIHSYYALAVSSILLFVIGAMMVLSASAVESISAEESAFGLFQRQVVFGVAGIAAMLVLSRLPSRLYRRISFPTFVISCVFLFAVVPFGVEVNGNRNWLSLGGFSLQPSEVAKLTCALMLGIWLGLSAGRITTWKDALWPSGLAVGIPVLFVMYGRDMGTALIFAMIYAAALFFAGAPLRLFLAAGAIGVVLAGGLIAVAPHRISRVSAWLTGDCDPAAGCYQAMHGLSALATGGWWGVGLGQSRSKYNYVPEAHNDFIFAIIGEELGLIGTVLILVLFAVMAVAMARVLMRSSSGFERIVTGSILAWLIGQAFVNIGMVTGLLPVIGVPLPFISYGGTSLMMCLAAVGVVMSFARAPSTPGAGDAAPRLRDGRPAGIEAVSAPGGRRGPDAYDDRRRNPAGPSRDAPRGQSRPHHGDEPIAEVHDIRRGRVLRGRSTP